MVVMIILIFITFLFAYSFNKTFGKVLPITLMSIPLIMFLSKFIFNSFRIGIYINMFLAILGIIITGKKILKKDKVFFSQIFSKGFLAILILFFLFLIIDYQRELSLWDELATWGQMVKEMLRLDTFYSVSESLLVWHKDYPPFISLFEYFWCFLLGYKEQTMLLSYHLFLTGLIVPYFVDTLKRKNMILLFPILLINVILMFDSYNIFLSIQTDFAISIEVLLGLIFIFIETNEKNKYHNIMITLILIALVLTKQIGIPLALMVYTFFFFNSLISEKKVKKNKKFG